MVNLAGFLSRWVAVVWLGLCAHLAAQAQMVSCLPDNAPGFVQPKAQDADSVVVYVHGLHGDPRSTWTYAPTWGQPVAWPCLVRDDREVFADSNVYLAAYDTEPLRPNPDMAEAARLLRRDLVTSGVFAHHKVSLVAHSMGGLVLAKMLTTPGLLSDQELRRIKLVVFVGTPALPTEAASVCSKFGLNRQCEEMQDPRAMTALWQAWDRLATRPATVCLAEGRDMAFLGLPPWLRIVPVDSAHRPCGSRQMRAVVDTMNHVDVVKPRSIADRPHRDLRNAFAACVQAARARAVVSAQQLQDEQAARFWVNALVDNLGSLSPGQRAPALGRQLAIADVNRFWFPPAQVEQGLDAEAYEQLNAPSFALAISAHLPLLQAEVQWVRPVGQTLDVVADSALRMLTRRMADAGGLRDTDLIVAMRARDDAPPARLHLLLVRQSMLDPRPMALLGLVVMPLPELRCGA